MFEKYSIQLSWQRFYEQCKSDVRLWCYFILFQQLCRLYFIVSLNHYLSSETGVTTVVYAMMHGLRFDSLWATSWLFISLLFFTLPSVFLDISNIKLQTYRRYLGAFFTLTTALIYVFSIEYFREYKDVFNQFLFNWFYDDKIAILKTIYADHNVVQNFVILFIVLFLYVLCSRYIIKTVSVRPRKYSIVYKILLSVCIIIFYVIGFRGSIGHRPIQLKDAGVTCDVFLNKAIVSPYSSLKYAINDYMDIKKMNMGDANLKPENIQEIAKRFFNLKKQYPSLSSYAEKRSKGSLFSKPQHVFLVVGESLDSWPMLDVYRHLLLAPNLTEIASKGICFKNFLASTNGTMSSLNTIMTGIPDMGLHINYQKTGYSLYPTSLAAQFKRLGYKTQFFYGGYSSWQRLEDFAYSQGFDVMYSAPKMIGWSQANEWGIDDRSLFDFIIGTLGKETQPTFNMIMTTSNHPPFTVDLKAEGFNFEKMEKLISRYPSTQNSLKEFGHIWYGDKAIGEFVDKMGKLEKKSLFAITGDHFGRRHLLSNPPLFDTAAVPLIIYSSDIEEYCGKHDCRKTDLIAGSHLDIGATLIELIAPQGFSYYSIGENLLGSRDINIGVGSDRIITPKFIIRSDGSEIMYLDEEKNKEVVPDDIEALKERFDQISSLARYMVIRGDKVYDNK